MLLIVQLFHIEISVLDEPVEVTRVTIYSQAQKSDTTSWDIELSKIEDEE